VRVAHLHKTSVRSACPSCGAKSFQLCVNAAGDPIERSHPERVAAARVVPQVTEEQLNAMDRIEANPATAMHRGVEAALKRNGWIVALDPPVPPSPDGRRRTMPKRRHQVTEAGQAIRVATGRAGRAAEAQGGVR